MLNVSPAFSVRREINLSPNADAGVKKPPESDTSLQRQRADSEIILLVEP